MFGALLQQSVNQAETYFPMLSTEELDSEKTLLDTKDLIRKEFEQSNGHEYLEYLVKLAEEIAQPKGGLLGFGKKLATEDQEAIEKVKSVLT